MPGSRISQIDRDRLIDAYTQGRDYIELADALGVNQRTAYHIVLQFKRTGRRQSLRSGGRPPKKVTSPMLEALIAFIEEKPTATLDEMRSLLLLKFPSAPVSTSTIMRHLDGAMITLKLVRTVPMQWNRTEVKEERADFARWMMTEGVTKKLVFVDECGFNVWTARSQGRAAKGCRAVRMVEGQRGKNLTLCLAVSPQFGFVHFYFVDGGMTKEFYCEFLSEVSALLQEEEIVIIQDNAPPHRDCPFLNERHCVRSLPRYSPFLNITENAISCLKSAAKRCISSPQMQREFANRERAKAEGITLQQLRLQTLRQVITGNLDVLTQEKCHNWYGHSLTYMNRCRDKVDIVD